MPERRSPRPPRHHPAPPRRLLAALLLLAAAGPTLAATAAAPPRAATALPPAVSAQLARAQVPPRALAVWLQALDAAQPRLDWNGRQAMNPASVQKLVTTSAALDLLGPAWTWTTPVWFTGPLRQGVLDGSVVIQGTGDPKLVIERVWLLLRRLRAAGVQEIRGDILLDNSAFVPPEATPGDFDGEPWRPYNVLPDALLLNYKAVTLSFLPEPARKLARVVADPALAGVTADASVPLLPGPCDDWRAGLRLDATDPARWHFAGGFPATCGEKSWPLAYAEPKTYNARLVDALWRELGGKLAGTVRDGRLAAGAQPAFEFASPPLADVIRDINKYSNNVMAEQLFLTLARERSGKPVVTQEDGRTVVTAWLTERLGTLPEDTVIVNGSGLARQTRISARTLAQLLLSVGHGAFMPELLSSLPVSGVDGTLRRSAAAAGRTHLKTGSMRDVAALAGEVLSASGRRWVLVALINDPHAGAAHGALDALVEWVGRDAPD